MSRWRFIPLAVVFAAATLWGQSIRPAPQSGNPAASAKAALRNAQPRLRDAQLESIIRAKFAKSKSANTFTVRVQGGVPTIDGKTDVVQHQAPPRTCRNPRARWR
jgi:hypothetical protein